MTFNRGSFWDLHKSFHFFVCVCVCVLLSDRIELVVA